MLKNNNNKIKLKNLATAAFYCFQQPEATWEGREWVTVPLLVLLIEQEIKAEQPFISCR